MDPIGESDDPNLFSYCSNSPEVSVDIFGLAKRITHGADATCICTCVWITKLTVEARKVPNQNGVKDSFDGTTVVVTIEYKSQKRKETGVPDLRYWERASKIDDQPLTKKFIKNPKPWEWYDSATATKQGIGTMFDAWHGRSCKNDVNTSIILLTDKSRHFKKDSPYYHWINIIAINPPCAPEGDRQPLLWGGFFFYPRPGQVLHSIDGGELK